MFIQYKTFFGRLVQVNWSYMLECVWTISVVRWNYVENVLGSAFILNETKY